MRNAPTATVLSKEQTEQLVRDTNKLCDAIPEDCWHHLQKITLADLFESPSAVLAINSFLANFEKLKSGIPLTTDSYLVILSELSHAINADPEANEIRHEMFKQINKLLRSPKKR